MTEIFEAVKKGAARIKDAIDMKDTSYSSAQNSSGDQQLKIDVKSDIILEEEFSKVPSIHTICSEEKDDAQLLNDAGKYFVAYDPVDGSSLIDVNLSVGTIVGIYEKGFSGPNLVGSCYVVYGPRVEMVTALEGKVQLFILQNGTFSYHKDLTMADKGMLKASGGTQKGWSKTHRELVDAFFEEGYQLRYSGGMVPDLHQILLKGGGLFSYPGTSDKPHGKLRMTFEVFPFAYVYEQAGGAATDGKSRILDLEPKHVHDTTPCFLGSTYEINRLKEAYERGE